MSIGRCNVGVGVLNGKMYVVGGMNNGYLLKSVEVYSPSDGVWTSIANMHLCRESPGNYNNPFFKSVFELNYIIFFNTGVVALNGLLYVIGGTRSNSDNSVEIYNPKTYSWSMRTVSIKDPIYGAVVVNRPPYL